jgi:hypothetical protein
VKTSICTGAEITEEKSQRAEFGSAWRERMKTVARASPHNLYVGAAESAPWAKSQRAEFRSAWRERMKRGEVAAGGAAYSAP